jgi:hypothetical protein
VSRAELYDATAVLLIPWLVVLPCGAFLSLSVGYGVLFLWLGMRGYVDWVMGREGGGDEDEETAGFEIRRRIW